MEKIFVGNPVDVGTSEKRYSKILMSDENVTMEFKGLRDGMAFTDKRLIVWNAQGLTGKKTEVLSFPWRSISAYSIENSGTMDLDAELKLCGSGWGVCEVQMTKGTDVSAVASELNKHLLE